jgi:hypothetical protein
MAEEEMAFSVSGVSGRERKRRAWLRQRRGVLLFSMDSKPRRWGSHGAWRTRGGKALQPVGTVATERIPVFSSSG